jgi:hypothetical protein
MSPWSLTTLRAKPIKIGANAIRHSKDVTLQLAEARYHGTCLKRSSTAPRG